MALARPAAAANEICTRPRRGFKQLGEYCSAALAMLAILAKL
jgi:hypothetical protein